MSAPPAAKLSTKTQHHPRHRRRRPALPRRRRLSSATSSGKFPNTTESSPRTHHRHRPRRRSLRPAHRAKWDELEHALDINFNTVDILSRIARSIPPNSGLRLITADISPTEIASIGEAPQPQAVNQFSLNLTKNNDLAPSPGKHRSHSNPTAAGNSTSPPPPQPPPLKPSATKSSILRTASLSLDFPQSDNSAPHLIPRHFPALTHVRPRKKTAHHSSPRGVRDPERLPFQPVHPAQGPL